MDTYVKVTLVSAALLSLWGHSDAVCYFPQQFQGEFVMQTTTNLGTGIQYTTVNVTSMSIPIWGNCHKRKGNNNFILMLNYRETSCIRCLHLKLRSANVLQVFALNQEIISKCYTNEDLAEKNCPSEESLANREAAEILLFKKNGLYTRKEYCPIDGKYSITYTSNNPSQPNDCTGYDSILDSCPSGSILNFRLRGCTASPNSFDLKFECMASWKGPNNEYYLIFADNNRQIGGPKPKYRCALFNHEYRTGDIHMALSRDSTCTTDLINSTHGFETFSLTPRQENPWPAETSFGTCTFPKWMHGNWEHVRVDYDTMIYRDHSSFKTYTIKCVGVQEDGSRYLIFSRTQCDEERYNCMRIVKRSNNILEFQLGSKASTTKDVFGLCSDDNFQDDSWITQGRTDAVEETSSGRCPISGEYIGVIPDGEDLCAKLWSDCDTSELMYYQVSHCKTNEVYEEREYRCLGHWRESEFLYTYTQRRDVAAGTYECFVGVKISNREIYIKEAGEHCQRHIDPLHYGMQLNKTNSVYTCSSSTPRNPPRTSTSPRRPTVSMLPTVRSTTKVWNFDTAGAETKNNDNASSAIVIKSTSLCIIVYILKSFM
ncbi:uncharacterized protein LOC123006442 [Tribolium madens]|uniref:uncharacterized protein LOC123006442 n=1 Tax=Tribolium madens TaxID=41895 RepID=UPI001CF72A5B|nr:uncharacterized protein LOC123006442 [Tribolium madens]